MEDRNLRYAEGLGRLIRKETISDFNMTDFTKFREFHQLLEAEFPAFFAVCEKEEFDGSLLLRWKGKSGEKPVMFMNHHDVVDAMGDWKYPPFAAEIHDGKLWGRGALDTKGGLYCMLQAADELAKEGFVPGNDIWFESACTEECDGSGCDNIVNILKDRGIRFELVIDEGGMIVSEPVAGAKGLFAMIGVGEKGCADLKFIARSDGGHASMPGKDTPLVRLGKFMAEVEKSNIFKAELPPVIAEMFRSIAPAIDGPLGRILAKPEPIAPLLTKVIPSVSPAAGAMLKTTLAFTMAQGSEGTNVLPQEAWVIGNMRYSHHQGGPASIEAVKKIAAKYDIETEILDPGQPSPVSDFRSGAFSLVCRAVNEIFPGVTTTPYIMTGASDCRYMCRVSDNCIRFAPFVISDEQMESIHGLNENVDVSCLANAVDFYKYLMKNA